MSTGRGRGLWFLLVLAAVAGTSQAAWEPGTQFRVGDVNGRPALVAPDGKPFRSVGVVWAYGPEAGPLKADLTVERLIEQLQLIKSLGFNTLNLYGDRFIPEMLDWCDKNELAVYFRTSYYSLPDFPTDLKEYPDYMDPEFRRMAQGTYTNFLRQIQGHPSVLAVDMDHRWLFPLDWGGARRFDTPKLRAKAVAHFPRWLESRYGDIGTLNAAWGTAYASFDAVIADRSLMADGQFKKLNFHPARADVFRYALWTAEDFLKDLTASMRAKVPGLLITPTTEHPECIPECNPRPDGGIDFMSPVHYNGKEDFLRDLPGLCKLIYETRWHYDLQGGPAYISETGFRCSTLNQDPPVTSYAWSVPPDETTTARMYAEQFGLLNVLPWVSGYGYFKLYDKPPEGDFGYLRDDMTRKPMSYVGDAVNEAFTGTFVEDPEPQAWIYYPDYALASRRPGFQQLKSWVAIWEEPFLSRLRERVDRALPALMEGDKKAGARFAKGVISDFRKRWRGFAFATEVPADDQPVVLLSTISEMLSAEDRAALMKKRTITFGAVGIRDDAMRPVSPWFLEALGLDVQSVSERFFRLDLTNGATAELALPEETMPILGATNSPWASIPADQYDRAVPCRGQVLALPPGRYTRVEVLAGSVGGNAAPLLEADYGDGERIACAMGPTISDVQYKPVMTDGFAWKGQHVSRIVIPLEAERELQKLVLPDAQWVRVFGIVLVKGGVATDARVALDDKGGSATGITPWRLPLEDVPEDVVVLERLAGGDPAVVAAGSHVAYLYDPLTWGGATNEISRLVSAHREMLDDVMSYLRKVDTDE